MKETPLFFNHPNQPSCCSHQMMTSRCVKVIWFCYTILDNRMQQENKTLCTFVSIFI